MGDAPPCLNLTLWDQKEQLPRSQRQGSVISIVVRQPNHVRAVRIHTIDFSPARIIAHRSEYYLCAISRPRRIPIHFRIVSNIDLLRPINVHDAYLRIPVLSRSESYFIPIR